METQTSVYYVVPRDFVIIAAAAGYPSNIPMVYRNVEPNFFFVKIHFLFIQFLYEVMRIALYVSCVFLIATIVVYLLLCKFQSFHGWTQFSYIIALLMFFIIQSVVNGFPELLQPTKNQGCFILGWMSYGSGLYSYIALLALT